MSNEIHHNVPAEPAGPSEVAEQEKYFSRAVCVDFDGVIAELSEDIAQFGRAIPGAAEAIREIRRWGYRVIIHTARPATPEHALRLGAWLVDHDILFDEINLNSECEWPTAKPLADLYIDDRALHFEGDWPATVRAARQRLLQPTTTGPAILGYSDALTLVTERRDEVARLEAFLSRETSWREAPASTRFHLCEAGGLVAHSLNVVSVLLELKRLLAPEVPDESCVIAGLYHDLGKAGIPGKPYYLSTDNGYRGARYRINDDLVHMDVPTRSIMLISRFLELTEDEAQAIRYHDGQYIPENRSVAHRERPLTRLLHYADSWAGGVIEAERKE